MTGLQERIYKMEHVDIQKSVLYAESWNVAWRKGNPGKILSDVKTPFNIISNSFRYWAADPFLYERDGEVYVFAELYDYVLCRGVLGYCKLNGSGRAKWIPIIVEEHHLSYPCIIEHEEQIYLMPESSEKKEVILYKAIDFPNKWKKEKVLREDVCFADTTPIKWIEDGFALTHKVDDPYHPQLMLIDLKNKYHDVNIEKAIGFQSRPAGHAFQVGSNFIRPSQFSLNCDDGYGKGLLFFEYSITEQKDYEENLIQKILPNELRYNKKILIDGMHTYNASENYEVIDIKTRRFNVLNLLFRLLNKAKHRLSR